MTRVVECLGVAVLWSSAALGQSTAVRPAFEVASVKPSKPGTPGFIGPAPGGQRFTATNASVRMLIIMAYNITDRQVSGGPGWIASEGYDIDAKAERPTTREQLYLMLQTLLADRFQLTLRRETREMPVYALVVDKAGSKLKRHESQDGVPPVIKGGGRGQVVFQNVPVSRLSWFLSTQVGRSVIDKTGLTGNYDFTLEWTRDSPSKDQGSDASPAVATDLGGPGIMTAVREQLGLRLESEKGPTEFLTIEHAKKPAEN
jgi:uncharacterized protein (TIGR03435 family)